MNEPHDMPTSLLLQNNQAVITAIRSTGAQHLILVPGNGFTAAHCWLNTTCSNTVLNCTPNADTLTLNVDAAVNFVWGFRVRVVKGFVGWICGVVVFSVSGFGC
jgi:endoglucanase